MVSCVWLYKHLADHISGNPDVLVEGMHKLALERFKVRVKTRFLYKVKVKSKEFMHKLYLQYSLYF